MKKICLLLLLSIISCKEKPTYNPFDDQFNIDESYFKKDKLDTIWDTCGYYTLSKNENNIEIFYGYFDKKILGKGFSVEIDTIKLNSEYYFELRDSINSIPFNYTKLNIALKKFDYEFYKQKLNHVLLINKKKNKIDTAFINSNETDNVYFYRNVNFIKKNKNYLNWY